MGGRSFHIQNHSLVGVNFIAAEIDCGNHGVTDKWGPRHVINLRRPQNRYWQRFPALYCNSGRRADDEYFFPGVEQRAFELYSGFEGIDPILFVGYPEIDRVLSHKSAEV